MVNQPWVTVLRVVGPKPDNTCPAAVAAAQYLQQLWRQCPNVRTLEVTHLHPTDVAVIGAEGLLPALTQLIVREVGVMDVVSALVATHGQQLTHLVLRNCPTRVYRPAVAAD